MPNAKTHKIYSLEYLGQYTPFLHKLMDAPAKEMRHTHRALFHDVSFLNYLEKELGEDARLEALLHIIVDLESIKPESERKVRLAGSPK